MAKKTAHKSVNIKNKKAYFDYEILETFTCGMVLCGSEIKSIRDGKASLRDTFCIVNKGEVWVKNLYIAEYFFASYNNHDTRRDRKLLLNKKEIRQIASAITNTGITAVPTRLFINEKGLAKLVIGLAKGKKQYDKRASLKEKDLKREMDSIKKIRY